MILRRCVHCRYLFEREALIRLTVNRTLQCYTLVIPGRNMPPSQSIETQGRSAYVCRQAACLQAALKMRKLQKALKCTFPDDIVGVLSDELEGLKTSDCGQSKNL